jgi:molybdate transport system regulatory protein
MGSPRIGVLKLRAQIMCGDEIAMGPGKADLLEAIEREGSISGASRALGFSYRRSWELADTMNRCWKTPLVETSPGGGRTAGARLTDAGRKVLQAYRALELRLQQEAAGEDLQSLTRSLCEAPKPRNY